MNIPLDRLYHFIDSIASEIYGDCVVIYRFWPHGSKNINNLSPLHNISWFEHSISPGIWCNDQEPLNYEFYKEIYAAQPNVFSILLESCKLSLPSKNLNYRKTIFEKGLLVHSEKRSDNLEKYQLDNELIPVYYWSHGIVARDWFRYAEHATFNKNIKKTFLIYNRAWSGTREYRLKFTDLLIKNNLVNQCHTNCNPIDPELNIHYIDYKFKNLQWLPTNKLENFLQPTTADATSSADFNINDYNSTNIEIVLETLFDDSRLHLTEKSLRPIACGQPFILAGTHGSLEYLRSYGFKTFGNIWDEKYDLVEDPEERLIMITDLMKQIATWTPEQQINKMAQARQIAEYNQQWFFSQEFFNLIITELKTNLKLAFNSLELGNNFKPWVDRAKHRLLYSEITNFLKTNQDPHSPTMETFNRVLEIAQYKLASSVNNKK